jgi:hypothetical protein
MGPHCTGDGSYGRQEMVLWAVLWAELVIPIFAEKLLKEVQF